MRRLLVILFLEVSLLTGCQRDISGTYLANDNADVLWLQLVRTPDNHLTGQLNISAMKPDGTIERNTVSVTGAVNESNVTMSGGTVALAGTFSWNKLTLTGLNSMPIVLVRSELSDYQKQEDALNIRSQNIIVAKNVAATKQKIDRQQQDLISSINATITQMEKFKSESDEHISRIPGAEDRYKVITSRVSQYVDRERSVANSPRAVVERSQLEVAANQASLDTDQLHNAVQSVRSSLEMDLRVIDPSISDLTKTCQTPPRLDMLSADQLQARSLACIRLESAVPAFKQTMLELSQGFNHLDQVYVQESQAQHQLLQTAQQLAR